MLLLIRFYSVCVVSYSQLIVIEPTYYIIPLDGLTLNKCKIISVVNFYRNYRHTIIYIITDSTSGGEAAAAACQEYKDIVFMLDSSLSICESTPSSSATCDNWARMLSFVTELIYTFPKNFRVAIISFSTQVSVHQVELFSPATDLASIGSKVNSVQFIGGNTNISGALRVARTLLADASSGLTGAPTDPSLVGILLTDGLSNVDASLVSQEARLAKQEGVNVSFV